MNEVLIPLAIILLLVIANGLFVAAEFAIVGAPRAAIEHRGRAGQPAGPARRPHPRVDPRQQDRYIATTQIGISVASLGLGMYGEHVLADWIERVGSAVRRRIAWFAAHALASVIAVAILTYFHIVIGEMVPKALALQRRRARRSTCRRSSRRCRWRSAARVGAQRGRQRPAGADRRDAAARTTGERYHTTEELQLIIHESQEGGMLRGESGRILRDLFEFGSLTAGEVMVPRVRLVGIPAGTDVDELRADHPRQPAHALSRLQRRLRPHCRQRARQGAAAAPGGEPAGDQPRRAAAAPTCPRPCRSTRCWRRCGATGRTWRW